MADAPDEADDELFCGIPYAELPIESVDWHYRGDYIRTRSQRKGSNEFDVEPEWATQAALDPRRLVSRGSSGSSIEVLGFSNDAPSRVPGHRGRVLKVWLVPKENPPSGDWWGASACDANANDRREYWMEE